MTARRILRRSVASKGACRRSPRTCIRCCGASTPRAACEDAQDLDLGLERLLPVSSLGGVEAAVDLLLALPSQRRQGARHRRLRRRRRDQHGASSCGSCGGSASRDPDFLVPDRFKFGYGLTPEIVRVAAADASPSLIVTVDNGISSLEGVAEAGALGIAVLVTDHHLPGTALPDAAAIVNPNLPGRALRVEVARRRGRGVLRDGGADAAHARDGHACRPRSDTNPADLLDLVALGTVADVVPLDLNNRILVAQGLRRIRAGRCAPGLRALLEVAGRRLDGVIAQDLGFQAGPRLNAAGRLEDMTLGIDCLLTDESGRGARTRRAPVAAEQRSARARGAHAAARRWRRSTRCAASLEGRMPAGLCLFDDGWHQGVIGLVASRVKDRVHRPVIAFAPGEPGWVKGSARSVAGRARARRARCDRDAPSRACSRNSAATRWRRA